MSYLMAIYCSRARGWAISYPAYLLETDCFTFYWSHCHIVFSMAVLDSINEGCVTGYRFRLAG